MYSNNYNSTTILEEYIPAVFGNTVPPRGLSGRIRRFAYGHSESTLYCWFSLILADRIDMIEGIIEDIFSGRLPNIWKERGLNAGLKHNPKKLALKFAIKTAVVHAF